MVILPSSLQSIGTALSIHQHGLFIGLHWWISLGDEHPGEDYDLLNAFVNGTAAKPAVQAEIMIR